MAKVLANSNHLINVTFTNNHYTVLTRLAKDGFHSSSELSVDLNLSRATIWKYLQNFSELGLEIIAVRGKGYRLKRKLELLSNLQIKENLNHKSLSLLSKLEIHPQIASTNSYLLEVMKTNPQSGYVCFAETQINGRGRRGRQWISPFGANIYLSLSWLFKNGFASISGLSLAVGVAVVRALTDFGIDNIGLKWPNDIYWQDKKLGGVLIEISGESSGKCNAVIGLGLNLYMPEKESSRISQPWTDLDKIITHQIRYSRNYLSALLLNNLLPVIASFETKTFMHYLSEWRGYDCMRGCEVSIYSGQHQFDGVIIGIDDSGLLLLKEITGTIKTFASGEVSFRKK